VNKIKGVDTARTV